MNPLNIGLDSVKIFFFGLRVCVLICGVSIKELTELGSCCEMQMCTNTNVLPLLMGNNALLKAEYHTLGLGLLALTL